MKAFRISTAVVAFTAISLLAACGGGGGGGSVTPPGGGGGGGPTPTPGATATPTPTATLSPTPAPTPTATATATGVPVDNIDGPINAAVNVVNQQDGGRGPAAPWYSSGTATWSNGSPGDSGEDSAGPTGPVGNSLDSMTCEDTQEGTSFPAGDYTQHAFVGILWNGVEEALPQALGMVNPVAPIGTGNPPHTSNTQEVEQYTCEYNMHTHDYSGLVHIEDVNLPQNTSFGYAPSYGTLQTLLDIWKATLDPVNGLTAGSNSLTGAVSIYVGQPTGTTSSGEDLVSTYTSVAVNPSSIMLARHNAVWIVIGSPQFPANGLRRVMFGLKN